MDKLSDRELKKYIASVYETESFSNLLRDMLHPGSLQLTRRLAEIAGINRRSRVLDMACAKGSTAKFLVGECGCNVVGFDLSVNMIAEAQSNIDERAHFLVADAEEMPFSDNQFHIAMSECSFSVLPEKREAAKEILRVLKPKGRFVLADVYLRRTAQDLPRSYRPSFPYIPCLSGAMSIEGYIALLAEVGFSQPYVEDHSSKLNGIAFQVGANFGGWENFLKALVSELTSSAPGQEGTGNPMDDFRWAFSKGRVGYVLLSVTKPQDL